MQSNVDNISLKTLTLFFMNKHIKMFLFGYIEYINMKKIINIDIVICIFVSVTQHLSCPVLSVLFT